MKQYKLIAVLAAGLCLPASASVLSGIADTMQTRSFAQMPANASLDALNIPYSLLYWCDSGEWDPVHNLVRWVGAGGTCCTDGQYYMLTYQEADNTWAVANAPFISSGHGYDGNAVNPNTGMVYFGRYGDANVHTYDGSSWGTLPTLPFGAATTPALTWFPEINAGSGGLVYMGAGGTLAWYNGSAWAVITGMGTSGSYNNFIQYSGANKVVWLGAGNGAETVHYLLNANRQVTRLANAPFSLNNSAAIHSTDPVTGNFIVCKLGDKTWWEFDPVADQWTQITGIRGPDPNAQSGGFFMVPIPKYGVNLIFQHYWEYRRIYLYKHASANDTLASIRVVPDTVTIEQNDTARFSARAFSTRGREMAESVTWSVSGGGSVSTAGLFTSNGAVGAFSVIARGTSNNSIADTARVTVVAPIPDTLKSLDMSPDSAIIGLNGTAQFTVKGRNQFNEDMDAAVTWSVSGGGAISASGLFAADGTPGTFTVTATASADTAIHATARVIVIEITSSVLIDFGATASANIFGTPGWNTAIKDGYTDYMNAGPGGTTIVTGSNGGYNYQGVTGAARVFAAGDKIVVTWYNHSPAAVTFTPRVSFDDPDRPGSGTGGTWYDMTAVTLAANGSGTSEYVLPAAGSFSLVNVNCNYGNTGVLICDKIEHTVDAGLERGATRSLSLGCGITAVPNPFRSSVVISAPSAGLLKIFDVHGRLVASFPGKDEITWNAGKMAAGLYLVKANSGNRVFTKKLLLNR